MTSIFLSHNHKDKPFVRRLATDISALGVKVWLDEAEMKVGDSIIAKITSAIDEMHYLGVVLSPNSASSRWVQEELQQALHTQMAIGKTKVLPILLRDCIMPGFLRDKVFADFRDEQNYESALGKILESMGTDTSTGAGARIRDPFASKFTRVENFYARPKVWHCIYCGWRCEESYNAYLCKQCNMVRPFAGESATMIECKDCKQWNLALSSFCEWCGKKINSTKN